MDVRLGLLFLLVLGATWVCDARQLVNTGQSDSDAVISEISVTQINYLDLETENQASEQIASTEVCTLCEEFAAKAIHYLNQNKTQFEIIDMLHESCSRLRTYKQQSRKRLCSTHLSAVHIPPWAIPGGKCITLVDYYAPLFFLEISSIQPADFCQKVNLCEFVVINSLRFREDSCGVCRRAVADILVKLKDPDTQLEIIELLLKACNSVKNYVKKCKKLVFEYGPVILVNAEQFLETRDVCTMLHACNSSTASSSKQASSTMNLSAPLDM